MISCTIVNGIKYNYSECCNIYITLLLLKSSLNLEARDYNGRFSDGDLLDSFTFPLSSPLNKFNSSNSIKVHGYQGIVLLTLSYGNLTTDPTPCNSMERPMSSSCTPTHYGNPTTDSCQCNSVEYPTSTITTQIHHSK